MTTDTLAGIRFGVSIPPAVTPGADPAAEARHAEELGFDLVTVMDHLHGQNPSLETWTVLTWIAARTERIQVAPNVLGLPYRHPAVTAKMAETLDRLSGGRFVLAVGAGGSNTEFGAFGLDVRSRPEKVEALEEAIDIIRGVWAGPEFTYQGKHFHTDAATIEPRPERSIPIWLGVYGNRMLDLLGRKADGWLPSKIYLPLEPAREKMDRIKKAAADAGRDPEEITYAYNVSVLVKEGATPRNGQIAGSPDEVAESLIELFESGFTFLNFWPSGSNQAEQRQRLANEVLPAVRQTL
ncbi:MAG: LLM class flavin-dependent oxidoreductase [Actinomycetota bacterium]